MLIGVITLQVGVQASFE